MIYFRNLLMEQARIEHAPNGSLLTYITSVDALVNFKHPVAMVRVPCDLLNLVFSPFHRTISNYIKFRLEILAFRH